MLNNLTQLKKYLRMGFLMDGQITESLTALNLIMGRRPHTYEERLFSNVKRKVKKEIERERGGEGDGDWVCYQGLAILYSSWSLTSVSVESLQALTSAGWEWAEKHRVRLQPGP